MVEYNQSVGDDRVVEEEKQNPTIESDVLLENGKYREQIN